MDDRVRGVLLAAGGMVLLSTDSYFIRLADTTGWDVLFWTGLFTAIVLVGGTALVDRPELVAGLRTEPALLVAAAVLQAAMMTCFVLAVERTTVANVAVIVAASPLAAAILSWFLLRERTEARVWVAIAVTAAGVVVVISGSLGGGSVLGDLFAVGAITAFGLVAVLFRRYPSVSRWLAVGFGGLLMAAVAAIPATFTGYRPASWLAFVAMGAVFGPTARVLIATAPRYLPAAEVALFSPIETVLASVWAFVAFDEAPPGLTWVGGAIILVAVLWGVWPRSAAVTTTQSA